MSNCFITPKGKSVILIHPMKCGGTSVRKAFPGSFYEKDEDMSFHMPSYWWKKNCPEIWNKSIKVGLARNTFSRFVSWYFYSQRTGRLPEPERSGQDVMKMQRLLKPRSQFVQWRLFRMYDPKELDMVLHQESLEDDWFKLWNDLIKEKTPELPRKNIAPQEVDFRQYMTGPIHDRLRRYCADEIEYFGYDLT